MFSSENCRFHRERLLWGIVFVLIEMKNNTFLVRKKKSLYLCHMYHQTEKTTKDQGRVVRLVLLVWMVAGGLMGLMSCDHVSDAVRVSVDSLNMLAYQQKYRSVEKAMRLTDEVLEKYADAGYYDGLHEAWLNRGDAYGMGMDYDSAQYCYKKVLEESNNDLICSVADVDMMSVCLMTSMSKEFYDYRSDAHERFASVEEESNDMTEHQQVMWNAVQTEYHFVSLNYFMKMRQDEGLMEEYEWLEEHQDMFVGDSTQMAAFLFLHALYSMNEDGSEAEADGMHRDLMRLLSMSRQKGYVYFEASALNSLARSVMQTGQMRPSRKVFVEELIEADGEGDFVLKLAERARKRAAEYGNAFVETTALLTLSDYYLQHGKDSLALVQMEQALELINRHHEKMCRAKKKDAGVRLHASVQGVLEDSLSTEMRWIADPDVSVVPEWIGMVREQLSIIYGAMGRKVDSDYNHNIYFDILDATRQDLRVKQEEEHLKGEEQMLNWLLWVLVVAIVLLSWLLYIYNKRSRNEYRKNVGALRRVIDICKQMSSVLAEELETEEDLDESLHAVSDKEVERLFPQMKGQDWTKVDVEQMKGLDKELFHVLQVFHEWTRQKGLLYLQFVEERQRLDSETYVFEKRLEENKRQYIEKLTSMSIVNGITPFLERALHEVSRLKADKEADEKATRERFVYLSELIDKINDYNDVLGHWVKIRQGMLTLNVENFALKPLFETLRHGGKSFDLKGVNLEVEETDAVVKADKTLTLFMMNTLLDNARKYTPEGGRVQLSACETDKYVEVSVEDTGHGMSPEDVDTINNAKVYDSSKIGKDGTHASDILRNKGFGFGLMNCKGIIGKYKKTSPVFSVCEFGVESTMEKGSRFFFRLPKGVLKAAMCFLLILSADMMNAQEVSTSLDSRLKIGVTHTDTTGVSQTDTIGVSHTDFKALKEGKESVLMDEAYRYADSVFSANVSGQYERSILFADSAIMCLNLHCLSLHPDCKQLMRLEDGAMAELHWWKQGFQTDYELVIRIRNEVAIAALALNRNALYHYNSESLTRLYKLSSTDPTLEEYCNDIKMANQNKKTTAILLGVLIFIVLATYFFLHYRNNQLFVFNLRQFIQLNNQVFTSTEQTFPKVLHQSLSDIKTADMIGVMMPSGSPAEPFSYDFSGEVADRNMYESIMLSAYHQKKEVQGDGGHFHAYPLSPPGMAEEPLTGVLGVRFSDERMSDEEMLIVNLVVQFISIHAYFSHYKVEELAELLELKKDERLRIDAEQQKVYVRNQIMDNSLSTLKHETMYYPNRIKQLVEAALATPSTPIDAATIGDIDELLSYYKAIFSILSTCAGKQVEAVLFKRVTLSVQNIGDMVVRTFKKQQKKMGGKAALKVAEGANVKVQGDKIFLQTLVDNIISLFFEHHSGGDLLLDFEVSDGFAKFAFTDTAYRHTDEDVSQLFYIDNVKYDAKTDTLSGAQYMICRQIIREHDAYSSRRGCRIYVENCTEGNGSRFVFTLPVAS